MDQIDNLLVRIGETVIETREKLHWSQQKLADKSGHSLRHIQNIEKGEVNLSVDMLIDVFRALGLSFDAFLVPESAKIEKEMAHLRIKLSACTEQEWRLIIDTMDYMATQMINNHKK